MTEADRKSKDGPFPKVPAGNVPTDLSALERKGADELDATFARPKREETPEFEHAPEQDDDLEKTITGLRTQQIPGLKLVKELGRGAAGVVYRGKQEFLDREVAVKMLLEQRKNPEFSARFKREAKILAGLQHPHIVACYQADVTAEGVCFLVMEFVNGPNLGEFIREHGPLDVIDALHVCRDLASALGCAYEQKIIHRDIKPENVLLAPEPRAPAESKFRYRAKLSDLGLARPQSNEAGTGSALHLTVAAAIMGTPLTMSPEQFDDPQGVDHRADIYGLGCVLYDMLTGKPAFKERTLTSLVIAKRKAARGPDPRAERPKVDSEVADLVMRMIASAREDRPQTYAELIENCDRLLEKLEGKPSVVETRIPMRVYAAVGAVCVLGGFGIWLATRGKGASDDDSGKPPDTPQVPVAFGVKIEPSHGKEGELVTLVAKLTGVEGSAVPEVHWKQVDGPPVKFLESGLQATFTAPHAKASYKLFFQASGTAGDKSATSETAVVEVEALDNIPTPEIDVPLGVKENAPVSVTANIVDPDDHGLLIYRWTKSKGPEVQFDATKNPLSFTAPEGSGPYDLEFTLEAKAGSTLLPSTSCKVHVDARNDPPVVTLNVPRSAEAGDTVSLSADVRDPDSLATLKYEWLCQDERPEPIVFEDKSSKETSFKAPLNAAGSYDLNLALRVTDLGETLTTPPTVVRVHWDPKLAPLGKDEVRSWFDQKENTPAGDWMQSVPPPTVAPSAGLFLLDSKTGQGWISHSLPLGSFVLSTKFDAQWPKGKECGLSIVYSDETARSFCFVPEKTEGEGRDFITYIASKGADGIWSQPPEPKRIGTWTCNKVMELEIRWDGTRLIPRWREAKEANDGVWIDGDPIQLPSRPRAASLFVDRARLGVSGISIQGL